MTEQDFWDQEEQYREQERQHLQDCNREMHEEKSRLNKNSFVVSLLQDSLKTIKWMHEHMHVIDKNLQSDAFNIPANSISQLEDYLQDWSVVYNQETPKYTATSNIDDELPF